MRRWIAAAAGFLLVSLSACPSRAIRPFVTDDARVVGEKLAQLETWMLVDRLTLQHNALAAVGPTNWLELTIGMIHGGIHSGEDSGYSVSGPILQGKALLIPALDGSWPGLAVAGGFLPPFGFGPLTPSHWAGFGYLASTESLFKEGLLLHANVGLSVGAHGSSIRGTASEVDPSTTVRAVPTAGFGLQARTVAGLHAVGEIYYGDPYDPEFRYPATQLGFRYIFSDNVQMDGTFGSTLTEVKNEAGEGEVEQTGSLGLRLVSPELW